MFTNYTNWKIQLLLGYFSYDIDRCKMVTPLTPGSLRYGKRVPVSWSFISSVK